MHMRNPLRNTQVNPAAAALVFGSGRILLFSVCCFLTGISTGSFMALSMDMSDKQKLLQYMLDYFSSGAQGIDHFALFFSSYGNNLVLLAIMLISGLSIFGFPIAFISLIYKGMTLGFSMCLILESLSMKGVLYIISKVLPQNLLLIPLFIVSASAAANYAVSVIKDLRSQNHTKIRSKNSLTERSSEKRSCHINPRSYIYLNIIFLTVLAAACLIESLIA